MNEHLVIYIDILGTKDAIQSKDEGRTAALIKLLSYMVSLRGDHALNIRTEEELIVSDIRPSVSTFSDLIVISYPVETLQKADTRYGLARGVQLAQGMIGYLAAAAIKIGFLIRGGATVGPLHHEGGVILGSALVEAHELKSPVARYPKSADAPGYPRIAVNKSLLERVKFPLIPLTFLTDKDGVTHLNYFIDMFLRSGEIEESRGIWLDNARQTIRENIARFKEEGGQREMEKWMWFEKQLEQARRLAAPYV